MGKFFDWFLLVIGGGIVYFVILIWHTFLLCVMLGFKVLIVAFSLCVYVLGFMKDLILVVFAQYETRELSDSMFQLWEDVKKEMF